MPEPNDAVWFGYASLYEQYGIDDAAIEAYEKVEKQVGHIDVASTYLLAQTRLKAIKTAHL